MRFVDFVNKYQCCAINHVPAEQVARMLDAVSVEFGALGEANRVRDYAQRNPMSTVNLRFSNCGFAGFSLNNEYSCGGFWHLRHVVSFEILELDFEFEPDECDLSAVFELC